MWLQRINFVEKQSSMKKNVIFFLAYKGILPDGKINEGHVIGAASILDLPNITSEFYDWIKNQIPIVEKKVGCEICITNLNLIK